MKKQTIQNFLNLPGIVGIALMDEHSRPYFCGIDKTLNFRQKEALIEGIQQVIGTTPPDFEAFDFRFAQRNAYIYKLINSLILLVVTDDQINIAIYQDAVIQLKQMLQANPQAVVSTFRLLSGSTTLQNQAEKNGRSDEDSRLTHNGKGGSQAFPREQASQGSPQYLWPEVVDTLNTITDATARYLGRLVVANAWQSTRLEASAIRYLDISRSGHFSCSSKVAVTLPMSWEHQELLQHWVQRFTARCSVVIRDYPDLVLRQTLTGRQQDILRIDMP